MVQVSGQSSGKHVSADSTIFHYKYGAVFEELSDGI